MAAAVLSHPSEDITASSYVGFDCEYLLSPLAQARPTLVWISRQIKKRVLINTAITRQIEHKLLKRGFQFNVMVVGA